MPAKRTWTDDDLIAAVSGSLTRAQGLRHLGLKPAGGSYVYVAQAISRLGLDISHFAGQGWSKGQYKPAPLQIEHVDGDHLNNVIENLKILCANCHMQTETWGFKGGRRRPTRALVA